MTSPTSRRPTARPSLATPRSSVPPGRRGCAARAFAPSRGCWDSTRPPRRSRTSRLRRSIQVSRRPTPRVRRHAPRRAAPRRPPATDTSTPAPIASAPCCTPTSPNRPTRSSPPPGSSRRRVRPVRRNRRAPGRQRQVRAVAPRAAPAARPAGPTGRAVGRHLDGVQGVDPLLPLALRDLPRCRRAALAGRLRDQHDRQPRALLRELRVERVPVPGRRRSSTRRGSSASSWSSPASV